MAIATTLTAIGSPAPTCLAAQAPSQAPPLHTHANVWQCQLLVILLSAARRPTQLRAPPSFVPKGCLIRLPSLTDGNITAMATIRVIDLVLE